MVLLLRRLTFIYFFSYLYFIWCLTLFFLHWSLYSSFPLLFDPFSFRIDKVLSINPYRNVLSLETLTSIIRTVSFFCEIGRTGELCYNIFIKTTLLRLLLLLLGFLTFPVSHSHVLLDLFLSSDSWIFPTVAFPPFRNSDHVVVPISIDFA